MKCKCGGLMQLRQLTMDTDAHVCVNCGRDDIPRKSAPADEPDEIPVPLPKPVPAPKPPPAEPFPKFGTCPSCQRTNIRLGHAGKCGRCAYRLKNKIDLALPNQKPGKAAPRSDDPAPAPIITHKKENTIMGAFGTCTTCHRTNISLQYKDTCARCHKRIAKGKDPLTGEKIGVVAKAAGAAILTYDKPISPITTVQPAPAANEAGAASSAPTPFAPITTVQATIGSPNIIGRIPDPGFTLDVMAAIDEAWLGKRTAIITQLQATPKTSEKLRIAFYTLASVNAMGTEA